MFFRYRSLRSPERIAHKRIASCSDRVIKVYPHAIWDSAVKREGNLWLRMVRGPLAEFFSKADLDGSRVQVKDAVGGASLSIIRASGGVPAVRGGNDSS